MKKFYVYWNRGSCNYGDHDCGLSNFDTLEEANKHADKLKSECYWDKSDDIVIIKGVEINEHN